ncbi:MAG: hypothetical protein V3U75_04230 [Methylococcaceae bacterium]
MAKKKAKKKAGQPTKYKPAYAAKAEKLCSEQGYTDENLAKYFKIAVSTLSNWKNKYEEFLAAIKKGKDEFDTEIVEQCLLKRCRGYTYIETTKELQGFGGEDKDDEDFEGDETVRVLMVTKKVKKQKAPDVTAQIFWLKNRNSERWKDRKEVQVGGPDGKPIPVTVIDYSKVDLARTPDDSNSSK